MTFPLVNWETPLTSEQKNTRRGQFYNWMVRFMPGSRRFLRR